MVSITLRDLIPKTNSPEAYIRFRTIEEWCFHNVPGKLWRFDHSSTICAYGVDIPGRIFFWDERDAVTFTLAFSY